MFSIKDVVFGKKKHSADYSDIRSHVINKPFLEPQQQTIKEKFGLEKDFPRDPYAPEPFAQPPQPFNTPNTPFEQQQFDQQPFNQRSFGERPDPRMDFGVEREQPRKDYDILDRLNIIESQLQAIRSQTETINERLKNLDARLGMRRY
jgi:hypothetical protein